MSLIKNLFKGVEGILLGQLDSVINEAKNPKSSVHFQPGDIDIVDILLMSEDQERTYSLMNQCVGFEVFESILSPTIFAELIIADSMALLETFPIGNGEYVKIVFKTPRNKGAPTNFLLRVNKIENKQINETNKRLTYTLQCVSAELIINSKTSTTLRGQDNISTLITNVLNDQLETSKPIFIDPTSGVEKVLLTGMKPFQIIDYLRQRAVSNQYLSSSFCFFENRKGFVFTTIERLFEQAFKEDDTDKLFFFDTSRKDRGDNVTYRNIIAFNQIQFGDIISTIEGGGLNNQVQEFDMITGNVNRVTYTDNIGADSFRSTSPTGTSSKSSTFTSNHGRSTSVTKLIPKRSDKPSGQIAEKISRTQAYAQKISQNIVQIHIYGDSDISAGDVIQCRLPSGADDKENEGVSRLTAGFYLVAKVRHMVLNNDRPQYTQALELIKSDLEEAR